MSILDRPACVLGIDSSLAGFAYALARPGEPIIEARIKTSPAVGVRGRIDRYLELCRPVVQVASQFQPQLVLIEGYAFAFAGGKQSGRAHDRAELGGILRYLLLPLVPTILEPAPATLKKYATGSGVADKAAVVSALARRYGRTFSSDDQADAFALAMMGLCIVGASAPENLPQREACAKVAEQLRSRKPNGSEAHP